MNNIVTLNEFVIIRKELSKLNKKIVFTNGCFDIIHAGHIDYINKAKEQGDVLIIGLNSDKSIKRIKGTNRPIIPENERAFTLANLKSVDYVILFDEDTPENLINNIIPDVLIKGADWNIENIIGKDIVEKNGGTVKTVDFVHQQSTSKIIKKILESYSD